MINKTWYDSCMMPLPALTLACNALRDEGWSVISASFSGLIASHKNTITMPGQQSQGVPVMVVVASKIGSSDQPEHIPAGNWNG